MGKGLGGIGVGFGWGYLLRRTRGGIRCGICGILQGSERKYGLAVVGDDEAAKNGEHDVADFIVLPCLEEVEVNEMHAGAGHAAAVTMIAGENGIQADVAAMIEGSGRHDQ